MRKVAVIGFLAFLAFLGISRLKAQDNAPLPVVKNFQIPGGKTFSQDMLQKGVSTLVLYFDPDCDHCQLEASWIAENLEKFKPYNVMWVSWGELEAIDEFQKKYFPKQPAYMFFMKDMDYAFDKYFGYSEVPSIYVYNRKWQRIASFKNETAPETLLNLLAK